MPPLSAREVSLAATQLPAVCCPSALPNWREEIGGQTGLQATDVPADPPWAWRCQVVSVLEPAGKSVLERDGGFRPDTDTPGPLPLF